MPADSVAATVPVSADAGSANAVENQIVILDPIAGGGHPGEASGARFDLVHTIAATAVKVMVVATVGGLETIGSTGQFDDPQPPGFDEVPDVAVDGGDPEIRDIPSCDLEALLGTQGPIGVLEGPSDGSVLPGHPLHQRRSSRRDRTTAR